MDMKKPIALLILCALLMSSLSCSQTAEKNVNTDDTGISSDTPGQEDTTASLYTEFEGVNYGGAEILIQTENTFKSGLDTCSNYLIETAGEETGDIVSDTAYRRNSPGSIQPICISRRSIRRLR